MEDGNPHLGQFIVMKRNLESKRRKELVAMDMGLGPLQLQSPSKYKSLV